MKKVQFKWFDVPQAPPEEMMVSLNKEGAVGWHFVHGVGTPTGLKFLMERVTDEEVDATDIEAYEKAQREAELVAKFGPQTGTGPNSGNTISIR